MTRTETTTDVTGRQHHTYTDGKDYSLGQHFGTIDENPAGFLVTLGWYERNGWNGSIEPVCSHRSPSRPYKSLKTAERRVAKWLAEQAN